MMPALFTRSPQSSMVRAVDGIVTAKESAPVVMIVDTTGVGGKETITGRPEGGAPARPMSQPNTDPADATTASTRGIFMITLSPREPFGRPPLMHDGPLNRPRHTAARAGPTD